MNDHTLSAFEREVLDPYDPEFRTTEDIHVFVGRSDGKVLVELDEGYSLFLTEAEATLMAMKLQRMAL